MTTEARFALADYTCVEPLVAHWPAWPHVIAPVTQSLHLLNYQIKTLRSYLSNPSLHETACRNPKLFGGAFVDIPAARAPDVASLLSEMERTLADNTTFASSLIEFQNRLTAEADGASLESFYQRAPAPLRGYVELIYDYFNHPIVRCLESCVYKSGYYKKSLQSLRLFPLRNDLSRSYFMSTPRLSDESAVDWNVSFDDGRIDELFELDHAPKALAEIRRLIGASSSQDEALRALLCETDGATREAWDESRVRVRYFGHACVLVECGGVSILVDPLISARPCEGGVERFGFRDLPDHIDYVLITHGHHDHFVVESLLRLRHRIGALIVPKSSSVFHGDISLVLLARQLGFRNVREADSFDEFPFRDGSIVAVPFLGEHNDLASAKSAYLVRFGTERILFAADSNCLEPEIYARMGREIGSIDTVFVGMECVGAPLTWVYGPILPVKPERRHSEARRSNGCNAEAAKSLARAVRCKRAFVYAVGREPWVRYLLALNPSEDDIYMVEINKFIHELETNSDVCARLLYGKAEIWI